MATSSRIDPDLARTSTATGFRAEARGLLGLAWPLALSLVGSTLQGFVATALVGRVDAAELAGVALGNGIFFTVSITAAGIVFGIDPLIAQALGAGEGARARAILRQGLRLSVALAALATLTLVVAPYLLPLAGIGPDSAAAARRFLWARAPGATPLVLLVTLRSYLQARHATRPILLAAVVANVVNLVLAIPLVLGDRGLAWVGLGPLGLAGLGAEGAGIAGSLATAAQLGVVALGVRALGPAKGDGSLDVPLRLLLRLGLPIGLTVLAEIGAFTIAGVLAGRIGPAAAGGHQVAISVASLTFTVSMAIGDATSVRVGMAVGRGDASQARRAGLAGLALVMGWMSFTALAFLTVGPAIARLATDREDVLAVAVPLMTVAAAFQLSDGAQVVGAGALRGLGDTKPAQWANLVGYYVVGLPLAFYLAFERGLGARGLWWGLSAGLTVVAVTLVGRFLRMSKRPVARVE
ncbi:MAG: MATE family efflux transporter [Deltaproteobacteria bacterium]|nr:MATE family efflux transporter [Deltaproteobacteria bacterium]